MDNLKIVDKKAVEIFRKKILNKEYKDMLIITDFDRTLTHAFLDDGSSVPSLISILRDENFLDENYSSSAKELFNKYHRYEIDSSLSDDVKFKKMEEWWSKHFEALFNSKLNLKDILKVSKSKRVKFRERVFNFLEFANKNEIPIVIFSSNGLGVESIEYVLKNHKLDFSNIHIVTNQLIWDLEGFAIDVKKPIIHLLNKDFSVVKNFNFYNLVKDKRDIILIGDSISDINMVKNKSYSNLLKIGFLNSNVDKNIDNHSKTFDLLILNDSSFKPLIQSLEIR